MAAARLSAGIPDDPPCSVTCVCAAAAEVVWTNTPPAFVIRVVGILDAGLVLGSTVVVLTATTLVRDVVLIVVVSVIEVSSVDITVVEIARVE